MMELYEPINRRRTVWEWKDKSVPQEVLERILSAGMQAPTHNHLRKKKNRLCSLRKHGV